MRKIIILICLICLFGSSMHSFASSSVLPNNLTLKSSDGSFINFNKLHSGYIVLTFIMPDSTACIYIQRWLNEYKKTFLNIDFYSITINNNKKLKEFETETNNDIPILIDSENKLGNLFEITFAPTLIVFKDGQMLIKKNWPIQNGQQELYDMFKDISEGKLLPHVKRELIITGNMLPYYKSKTINGNEFCTTKINYPSIYAFISIKCEACHEMLKHLIELDKKHILPDVYLVIIDDDKQSIIKDELIRDLKTKNKFHIIIDSDRDFYDLLKNQTGIEIDAYPTYFLVGKGEIIKWGKIGYNSQTFEKTLFSAINIFNK